MNEHDDLIARLRAMGEHPVDPSTASRHLTAMAGVTPRARVSRFGRARVVAAFAAGLVLGGTSLASAGVMGETVQNKVADVAEHVNVNLPGGSVDRVDTGECAGATNHGQWVKTHKGEGSAADVAKSDCGKPTKAVQNKAPNAKGSDNANRSECAPPWAGKGKAAKGIKADNPNWKPAAGCADTNGTEAPETKSDTTDTPKANTPPQANQGQSTAEQNKPATTPSVSGPQTAEQHDSTGTVETQDHAETTPTPSSTVPPERP